MTVSEKLDAHARPPEHMRVLFKKWQKASSQTIAESPDLLDFSILPGHATDRFTYVELEASRLDAAFEQFLATSIQIGRGGISDTSPKARCFGVKALPGLYVYPSLVPPAVQEGLLEKTLHRDLCNPLHKTNLHLHYHMQYPRPELQCEVSGQNSCSSFFGIGPDIELEPRDLTIHKSLTIKQMLNRKLRWMTLGGQYDWTTKLYPSERPPQFPADLSQLLRSMFPSVDAQAAIVNLYTPGDTLSVHRDVSEDCDRGLISISIGCDGIFIISDEAADTAVSIRLKSGDAILMSDKSRFAWHAVPRILSETCPNWLSNWPALDNDTRYGHWEGWMRTKRINLNVRQMKLETF